MCSSDESPLDELTAALDRVSAEPLAELPNAALAERLGALTAHASRLQAEILRATASFDDHGGAADDGAATTAAWLRGRCRLGGRAASRQVHLARDLHRRLPMTAAALAAGTITPAHARAMADGARDLPDQVVLDGEAALLDAAPTSTRCSSPRSWPGGGPTSTPNSSSDDAERQRERRHLYAAVTYGGVVDIKGMLDTEGGATVLAALSALAGPGGGDDARTAAQRRADALVELARRALDCADLPESGGEKPHVNVTVDIQTLTSGDGNADLDWTGPIPAETALRLACDAGISRVLLAGDSQPLDIGRRTRTIPPALRRALTIRDRHCQYPACDRPAAWCDGHHARHWANGGDTALPNLILLCRFHHTYVHDKHLTITRDPEGTVTFHPPDTSPGQPQPRARAA